MQVQMNQLEAGAEFLKVISHPVRLCIIQKLINETTNVSSITECLAMPQSTISTHLQKLRSAGIMSVGTEINSLKNGPCTLHWLKK